MANQSLRKGRSLTKLSKFVKKGLNRLEVGRAQRRKGMVVVDDQAVKSASGVARGSLYWFKPRAACSGTHATWHWPDSGPVLLPVVSLQIRHRYLSLVNVLDN